MTQRHRRRTHTARALLTTWLLAAISQASLAAQSVAPEQTADVPRASFIGVMDAQFRKRDADSDGFVTQAELQKSEAEAALAAARANNGAVFKQLDADGSGSLSPAEFAALIGPVTEPDVSAQMGRLDANADKKVSLIEYRAVTLATFDRLDTDLDGIVTPDEMRAGKIAPVGR